MAAPPCSTALLFAAALTGPLDLEQLSACSWSTCSVVWPMPKRSCEQLLELAPDAVAVVAGRDEHVGGERGEAGGHLPHVEVVDLDHAGVAGERAADRVGVEAARRALEQHPAASRSRLQAVRSISAETSSAAIGSA